MVQHKQHRRPRVGGKAGLYCRRAGNGRAQCNRRMLCVQRVAYVHGSRQIQSNAQRRRHLADRRDSSRCRGVCLFTVHARVRLCVYEAAQHSHSGRVRAAESTEDQTCLGPDDGVKAHGQSAFLGHLDILKMEDSRSCVKQSPGASTLYSDGCEPECTLHTRIHTPPTHSPTHAHMETTAPEFNTLAHFKKIANN